MLNKTLMFGSMCYDAINRELRNAKYWFKNRFIPSDMHHVVWTDLEPGWHDVDYVLLHACFSLLCRFVEDENGGIEKLQEDEKHLRDEKNHGQLENGCYNPSEMMIGQADSTKEIIALYKWWTEDRPADQKKQEALIDAEHYDDYKQLEDKMNDDEQKMLHRLIEVRRSLWT